MKKLLIGLLALGSMRVFAGEMNSFKTLGDLFQDGSTPKYSELADQVWTGRCFTKSDPTIPYPGAIIIRTKNGYNPDIGPISSPKFISYEFLLMSTMREPTFYDEMNFTREGIEKSYGKFFNDLYDNVSGIVAQPIETVNGHTLVIEELKVSNKMLIKETNWDYGDITMRCYYFNRRDI